ncbi:MAG TPA: hypothetical protein VGP89_06955 [Candidatus Angelobacter sp.]|jgi:hypothetical protein|nr:hypothetical protein [Candidatus Angelobacter sp.]
MMSTKHGTRNGVRISLGIQKPLWLKVEVKDYKPLPNELAAAISEYARKNGVVFESSNLVAGSYSEALDQVESELTKKNAASWPWKLFGRTRK